MAQAKSTHKKTNKTAGTRSAGAAAETGRVVGNGLEGVIPSKIESTKKKKVYAARCPRNGNHKKTRVYRTLTKVRYCVCDDCGHTWKQTVVET